MKELTPETLYAWATTRCARSECSRGEMERKMREKGASAELARTLAVRLEAEGYVDDARFAKAFVHDRTLYERWGRIKTRQALLLRGVSSEIANDALQDIDEEQYTETLRSLLASKARTLRTENATQRRQKLMRFAASRGFEAHLIMDNLPEGDEE